MSVCLCECVPGGGVVINQGSLSTRNCQPSTNTALAINTIFVSPSSFAILPCHSSLLFCFPAFSSVPLSFAKLILSPYLFLLLLLMPLFMPSPLRTILGGSSSSPLLVVALPRSVWQWQKERWREEACVIGFFRCDRGGEGGVKYACMWLYVCVCSDAMEETV